MNDQLKDKIKSIYELINRGATEGERQAAKKALDRIIKKHNIDETMLNEIEFKNYVFKYSTILEMYLLVVLIKFFAANCLDKTFRGVKYIQSTMLYTDYITVDSAYEYFRRHMKVQWNKLCANEVKRCRRSKTKMKRRKQLQEIFFDQYTIKSKLCKEEDLVQITVNDKKELMDRMLLSDIEGGVFNRQVVNSYLLEN